MKYSAVIDQIVGNADDTSASFRAAVLRWLNLTRADIADRGVWRSAVRPKATFTASVSRAVGDEGTGIYGIGTTYERILGNYLYDVTNDATIRHEGLVSGYASDPDQSVTGNAQIWGDAGMNENGTGERYVRLWPIPSAQATIRFIGYLRLLDVTDENLETDPFFGSILPWSSTFAAGMRYYMDLDNNEDTNATVISKTVFDKAIKRRMSTNNVAPSGTMSLEPVNSGGAGSGFGRLNPSHFAN